MAEVFITKDNKTSAWVMEQYNKGKGKYVESSVPNIFALWHFSEGSGTTSAEIINNLNVSNIKNWLRRDVALDISLNERNILTSKGNENIAGDSGVLLVGDSGVNTIIDGKTIRINSDIVLSDGSSGITNTNNYWLCKDASCNTTCQVQIKNGLIVGCE